MMIVGLMVGFYKGNWDGFFIVLVINLNNNIFVILSIVILDNMEVEFNVG